MTAGDLFGQLFASTTAIDGAYVYTWRVAVASAPTVYVAHVQTTRASAEFDGLERGEIYLIQVNAVGTAGTTDWSDAANITAP